MPKTERPQGRQPFRADHDELRRGILLATFERPRTLNKLYEDLGVYAPSGKYVVKNLLREMLREGILVTQETLYLNAEMPVGYLMSIPG